jgi:hypothetical protein
LYRFVGELDDRLRSPLSWLISRLLDIDRPRVGNTIAYAAGGTQRRLALSR